MKRPFLKLFYPKKKKTELERVLFLIFMLFLMKINLKSYLVFKYCYFKHCNFIKMMKGAVF
ncbi:hypothetical protein FIM36_03270 [Helicobacter pylori]|uniref:hypothetical protein n=1 Tax=Helicobacter pylori TaxID=210 RepID=UPI00112D1177|nr:hypothetical protein [Helicobacter pylori]TPI04873.1 hypothetical protein FIM36_03270 [Helicobacter pylori]